MSRIIRPEEPMLNISAWVSPRLPKKSRITFAQVAAILYPVLIVCTAFTPELQIVNYVLLAGLFGYCAGKIYYFFRS